jgi:hypothetical protein
MEAWKLVLDEDAFHFFSSAKADQRRRLLSAFEELRANPRRQADYETKDSTDRVLNVWARQPFLITYWLDAFVSEIRIVNIQKVRW